MFKVTNWVISRAVSGYALQRTLATNTKMTGETYTLKYFNFRVLGEPIRWQLALAGIQFNDIRLPRGSEWETDLKQKLGWGRLPILVVNEKTEITQSASISRYLANKYGLMPKNDLDKARCDELVDNLQDLRMLWRPWVRETDPIKKQELEKELRDTHFPFYLPRIEEFMKTYGQNGYCVGDKLTWADLYLANFTEIYTDNHGQGVIKGFPLLSQHMNKILNIPQIKEWNSKRPQSPF